MASFCKQCSEVMWGYDDKDAANLLPPDKYTDEMGAGFLCECCGPIVVDIDGKRMSEEFFESCDCADFIQERPEEIPEGQA